MNRQQFNITDERRRNEIINYVRSHQGCTRADITRGLEGIVSKKTINKYVVEMIKDGIVYYNKERENSRDHKLFLATDNILVSVPDELEEFERAYNNLLRKSKEMIDRKDFSLIRKSIDIAQSDPSKWTQSDIERFMIYQIVKLQDIYDKMEKLDSSFEKDESSIQEYLSKHKSTNDRRKALKRFEELRLKIVTSLDSLKEGFRDCEVALLIQGAIAIFYSLTDMYFYRATMIWSTTIQDKASLKKLYVLVYSRISEIQFSLSRFLETTQIMQISSPMTQIINSRSRYSDELLSCCLLTYGILGMQNEIEPVVSALARINSQIQESRDPQLDFSRWRKFLQAAGPQCV